MRLRFVALYLLTLLFKVLTMTYATDGKCHNAEPGTFNHECGNPANWVGYKANGYGAGFCDKCKQYGHERKDIVRWNPIIRAALVFTPSTGYLGVK